MVQVGQWHMWASTIWLTTKKYFDFRFFLGCLSYKTRYSIDKYKSITNKLCGNPLKLHGNALGKYAMGLEF